MFEINVLNFYVRVLELFRFFIVPNCFSNLVFRIDLTILEKVTFIKYLYNLDIELDETSEDEQIGQCPGEVL